MRAAVISAIEATPILRSLDLKTVVFIAVAIGLFFVIKSQLAAALRFIGKDEQLRIQKLGELVCQNGPGFALLLPFTYRSAELVKGKTLGEMDYVKVKDTTAGSERIERGPKLLFLGAYDQIVSENQGITLTSLDYVLVEDRVSGVKRIEKGPAIWFPEPQEDGVKKSGVSLSNTEYALIKNMQSGKKRVEKGPMVYFPEPMEQPDKGSGITLGKTDYVLVEDKLSGEKRIEKGPAVWFPGPEESGKKGEGVSLSGTNYIFVEDKLSGEKTVVKGPCVWFPGPYEQQSSSVETAISLQSDEYVRIKNMASGERWIHKGKALVFLEPTWKVETSDAPSSGKRKAFVLKSYEYVRLIDQVTGKVTNHRGEATIFPGPDEKAMDGEKRACIDVAVNEYVKILDQETGETRVVAGPSQVFLGPLESVAESKQEACAVDEQHSLMVRDKATGQLRLVTDKQLFVPSANEEVDEQCSLITLAEHEAMIVKDAEGNFRYHFGKDKSQATFFLQPYEEIVTLHWSSGPKRDRKNLDIQRIDTRSQYMAFEFNTRTKDNVELVLEGVFFWQLENIPLMVKTTGDTTGDICAHARSQFIKHVAKVSLKEFMEGLNEISQVVLTEDAEFYSKRGVKIHSLEVTGYRCLEKSTSQVLQQIIQETTNRMNRLSKQESENEVNIFKMRGQIEEEQLYSRLLDIQNEHAQNKAKVEGQSEAQRVKSFVDGLSRDVPELVQRMDLWHTLRKTEALNEVSNGNARIYYTPQNSKVNVKGRAVDVTAA